MIFISCISSLILWCVELKAQLYLMKKNWDTKCSFHWKYKHKEEKMMDHYWVCWTSSSAYKCLGICLNFMHMNSPPQLPWASLWVQNKTQEYVQLRVPKSMLCFYNINFNTKILVLSPGGFFFPSSLRTEINNNKIWKRLKWLLISSIISQSAWLQNFMKITFSCHTMFYILGRILVSAVKWNKFHWNKFHLALKTD